MTLKIKGFITFAVVIVLSISLSIGAHLVFEPIRQERADRVTLEVLESYFSEVTRFESNALETIEGVEITRSLRALNADEPLGYLYEANITNEFGNMRIRISVDVKDIIQSVEFVELNQTLYQDQTRNMLNTYVLTKLETDIFDGAAGATSISRNDVSRLMRILGRHHDQSDKFEFVLPYVAYYGPDYVVSETQNLNQNDATIVVETISGQGVVYTITKSGVYQTGSIEAKSITLVLALDSNNEIIGIDLPVEGYNHTKGNFMRSAITFAESFIGTNLADATDGSTGASGDGEAHNSRNLIEDMILIIQSIQIGTAPEVLPYVAFFGEAYVVETTENLNESDATIVVERIKDLGYVYTITKSGLYRTDRTDERSITMVVALDDTGKILGVLLPEDLYNHTAGNFYTNALTFAQGYVDMNLADVTDGNAGASESGQAYNSKTLIEDMMLIIQNVHTITPPESLPYAEFFGDAYEIEFTLNETDTDASIIIEGIKDQGYVYTITKSGLYRPTREDLRSMTLVVVIDMNNIIKGVRLPEDLYEHSGGGYYQDALAYALGFVDTDINDLIDGTSGSTDVGTAFTSRSLIEDMMLIIQNVHATTLEDTKYIAHFGVGYEVESTQNQTISNAELVIENIKDQGFVYTITKSGLYRTDRTEERSITMVVVLDVTGKIIAVLLPETSYNHSKGSFYTNALTFVSGYVDMNLADVTDGNAGVSESGQAYNSKTLIEDMMLIVQGVHSA